MYKYTFLYICSHVNFLLHFYSNEEKEFSSSSLENELFFKPLTNKKRVIFRLFSFAGFLLLANILMRLTHTTQSHTHTDTNAY